MALMVALMVALFMFGMHPDQMHGAPDHGMSQQAQTQPAPTSGEHAHPEAPR